MSYKSILTIITDPALLQPTIAMAAAVSRANAAHLEVLCLGVDRTQITGFYPGDGVILLDETLQQAQADAQALHQAARALLEQDDLRWSLEWGAAQESGIAGLVSERARYCDLVVLPGPRGKSGNRDADLLIEAALFGGQVPVLLAPAAGLPAQWGERVVLAWNQSREAMRALRAALPLLQAARSVSVAIVDPQHFGAERSDPGGALCVMLARHGIRAEVAVLARTLPRVADILNRHARDTGASLVVMGAYGHARLREYVLGGATRSMIDAADVPVFLAH